MRRKRSFIQAFLRLAMEDRVAVFAALVMLVSCFLPWYGITSRLMNQWSNGFGNIGSIVGYLTFLLSGAGIYMLLAPVMHLPLPRVLQSRLSIVFLFAQAGILLFVLSTIYTRYTVFDAPGSSVRFGLYTALIASVIATCAVLISWKKHAAEMRRRGAYEDFVHLPRKQEPLYHEPLKPEFAASAEKPRAPEAHVSVEKHAHESPVEAQRAVEEQRFNFQ